MPMPEDLSASRLSRTGALLVCMACLAVDPVTVARAAVPPVAPPTRDEIQRVPTAPPAAPRSRLTVSEAIEHAPCPLDDPRSADITVKLDDVVFDRLEGVDPTTLRPAFAGMLGRALPIAAVCAIRDAAGTRLRAQGYVAAVEIPPQRISGGTLHLRVLMARVVAVRIEGAEGRGARLVAAYLDRLKALRPFNEHAAERVLLMIRQIPGYDVAVALAPAGGAQGDVIAEATVTRTPVEIEANVQDYGSHALGRWSGYARIALDGILGIGDRAVLGVSNTAERHEQSVVEAAYDVRPGTSGLKISAHVTDAWTRPDLGTVDPLHGRNLIYGFEISRPLVVRRSQTVSAAFGIDVIRQRLRFADTPFNDDRLRVLYARLDADTLDRASIADRPGYSSAEPPWRVSGSLEFRRGTGLFGASRNCGGPPDYPRCVTTPTLSRFDGDPRAGLVRIGGSLEWRPSPAVALVLAPSGQYAFAPLLSYEQYSAGTYTIGRGYDPGVLIGDSGIGTQAELRYGHGLPRAANRLALQPFLFTDTAWVWTRGPLAPDHGARNIVSVGGGLHAAYGARGRLDLLLAVPLRDTPFQKVAGDVRLLFSLTTQFAPWRHT